MSVPTFRDFPEFRTNPAVLDLAAEPRWTISQPENKRPMDMRAILAGEGVWGAKFPDQRCLVTLDELDAAVPDAANNAFYLMGPIDQVLVLDIEKTCPPAVAYPLLAMPHLYHEVSLSGRGHHLIMPLPPSFASFPDATAATKVMHPKGWYEVLVNHYVTFTRDTRPVPAGVAQATAADWDQVWSELAKTARPRVEMGWQISAERPEIPFAEELVPFLAERSYTKTLADFDDDNSRYEFALLGFWLRTMEQLIPALERKLGRAYSDEELAWMLYDVAVRCLEHRPKHDELRSGVPYLLQRAQQMVNHHYADNPRTTGV